MIVIRTPDPVSFRLTGPFASLLEAREYLIDTVGTFHGAELIELEPPDPAGLVEPGL